MVEEIDKKTGVIEALSPVWVLRPGVKVRSIFLLFQLYFATGSWEKNDSMEMVANK